MKNADVLFSIRSIALAVALLFSVTEPTYSQSYGITASENVYTNLPTTTEGGGGLYTYSVSSGTLAQISYGASPIGHSDSVSAFDPNANAIYTASASSSVNQLSVSSGAVHAFASISGGVLDPNVGVESQANTYALWTDTLYVSGLPAGTPVTLQFTDVLHGNLQLSGNIDPGTRIYQLGDLACAVAPSCEAEAQNSYTSSGAIASKQVVDLLTYSGAVLKLTNLETIFLDGRDGQWSATADTSDTASVFVDDLTKGANITSASGINYASPVPLPPSAWLMLSGLVGVGAIARRRRAD